MPGGAPGRCANARTTGCGERRAGDAKSKYSDALTGEMAARTIPLYVYLFLTGRTRRGFPFFVLARPSERRKSCRETPVLRRAATAICAGRPRRDAGKDTTDCTGMLTSGASAGGQEMSCRETGVSPTSCVLTSQNTSRSKVPMRKLSTSRGIKTEVHAPGFYAAASRLLFDARCRAAAHEAKKCSI